jgi:TPR repeat protein
MNKYLIHFWLIVACSVSLLSCTSSPVKNYNDAIALLEKGDRKTAHEIFVLLSDQGDDRAQYQLGQMYDYGQGVDHNIDKAVYWYERASAAGNKQAQHSLGVIYIVGRGLMPDYDSAVHWLNKSAEQGYVPAYSELGWAYLKRGKNFSDLCNAIYWYNLSPDSINIPAMIKNISPETHNKCDTYINGDNREHP